MFFDVENRERTGKEREKRRMDEDLENAVHLPRQIGLKSRHTRKAALIRTHSKSQAKKSRKRTEREADVHN